MSPAPNKRIGNRLERKIVEAFEEAGYPAERAWGSDGRALGEAEGVDVKVRLNDLADLRIQAKRRKALAAYLEPPEGCDIVIVQKPRKEPLAVIPLSLLLELLP